MKKYLLLVLLTAFNVVLSAQTLVSKTLLATLTKSELDSVLTENGIPANVLGTEFGVQVYRVAYNTVSVDSTPTIASGMVAFPIGFDCKLPIVSYAHSPTGNRNFVPSRLAGQEALIALVLGSIGNIAVSPDYLGLGDSPGEHPFMHAKSEATASIDLIRAARELTDTLGVQKNGQVLFSGYSQGGQAAMAAHKMAQEKLSGEIEVAASFPMSGPYNMSSVMLDAMLTDPQYPEPAFLAYIVYSYTKIYSLYDTITDILASPYDSLLPPIFNGSGNFFSIGNLVTGPAYSMFKADTVSAWLSDATHPFRLALKDNDIDSWVPNATLRMIYCGGDSYIPASNARNTYEYMLANGALNVDTQNIGPYEHQDCAQLAILAAKNHLNDNTNPDCTTGIKDGELESPIVIYPNPASDLLWIRNLPHDVNTIGIFSVDGRKIVDVDAENSAIRISDLSGGLYLLHITTTSGHVHNIRFAKQ